MKVISGGQSGVDRAGLDAAYDLGIKTGGYAPRNFKTLDGLRPELGSKYGLIALGASYYKERTYANVQMADATLRLARYWSSPGEICTMNAIKKFNKTFLDVPMPAIKLDASYSRNDDILIETIITWLRKHGIVILNVAGNSECTAPGIGIEAYTLLYKLFDACKTRR